MIVIKIILIVLAIILLVKAILDEDFDILYLSFLLFLIGFGLEKIG